MEKLCKICGKTFEAVNSNYSMCSPECRKENKKRYDREYIKPHKRAYEPKMLNCKICGKPVNQSRKRYHEECVLQDAVNAYKNGDRYPSPRIVRAINQGYSTPEIREIAEAEEE
jgi:hypothetical protein